MRGLCGDGPPVRFKACSYRACASDAVTHLHTAATCNCRMSLARARPKVWRTTACTHKPALQSPAPLASRATGPPPNLLGPRGRPSENPSQNWKRRKELEEKSGNHDQRRVAQYPAYDPVPKWWIGWPVIRRPGKCPFPILLRNVGRPNSLKRYPRTISLNATFTRDGIPQIQDVTPPYEVDCVFDHETHKGQN